MVDIFMSSDSSFRPRCTVPLTKVRAIFWRVQLCHSQYSGMFFLENATAPLSNFRAIFQRVPLCQSQFSELFSWTVLLCHSQFSEIFPRECHSATINLQGCFLWGVPQLCHSQISELFFSCFQRLTLAHSQFSGMFFCGVRTHHNNTL